MAQNQKEIVNNMAGEAIKTLIEFCINEKIKNPKIVIDAKITDGEHYRLTFERIDLDEKIKNKTKEIVKQWLK